MPNTQSADHQLCTTLTVKLPHTSYACTQSFSSISIAVRWLFISTVDMCLELVEHTVLFRRA